MTVPRPADEPLGAADHQRSAAPVGLLEGMATTRAIRRFTDEPIPLDDLNTMLWHATRAPTGSNRQGFRFVVLRDGPRARQARQVLARAAQELWRTKERRDGYTRNLVAGEVPTPKARMAATMADFVAGFAEVPVLVLPCMVRHRPASPRDGASVYPACQNLLLAARALGYGGVLTSFQAEAEPELRAILDIPDDVFVAATIALGRPAGNHGPVRRRPVEELIYEDRWDLAAPWACDPPGTRFTQAGPPGR